MPYPSLPNEILREIVLYLDGKRPDDIACLRSIRLVSQAGRAFSTGPLFRHVRLSAGLDKSTSQMDGLANSRLIRLTESLLIPYSCIVWGQGVVRLRLPSLTEKLKHTTDYDPDADNFDEENSGPITYSMGHDRFKDSLGRFLNAAEVLSEVTVDASRPPADWNSPWSVALYQAVFTSLGNNPTPKLSSLRLINVDADAMYVLSSNFEPGESASELFRKLVSGRIPTLAKLRKFEVQADQTMTGSKSNDCVDTVRSSFKCANKLANAEEISFTFAAQQWRPRDFHFPSQRNHCTGLKKISLTTLHTYARHLEGIFRGCDKLTSVSLRDLCISEPTARWMSVFDAIAGLDGLTHIRFENLSYHIFHIWSERRERSSDDEPFKPLYSPDPPDFEFFEVLCESVKARRSQHRLPKDDILEDFYLSESCNSVSRNLVKRYAELDSPWDHLLANGLITEATPPDEWPEDLNHAPSGYFTRPSRIGTYAIYSVEFSAPMDIKSNSELFVQLYTHSAMKGIFVECSLTTAGISISEIRRTASAPVQ